MLFIRKIFIKKFSKDIPFVEGVLFTDANRSAVTLYQQATQDEMFD